MSLQNELQNCLASLDTPVLIHLNHTSRRSRSPSPSTQSFVMHPSRARSDSYRRPYTRSPLGDLSVADNSPVARPSSRASSFSGSIIIGRESKTSVRRDTLNSFQALPPILSGSSLQFRSNADFNFQSFIISSNHGTRSRRSSRMGERPPALPPLPSLSQPLFPPTEANPPLKEPLRIRTINHPNSPYVPWDSPMRREIFRPLTPESSVSLISECSRSGARAPEPAEYSETADARKLGKVSRGFKKMHQTVKKNFTDVAKRIFSRQRPAEAEQFPSQLTITTRGMSDTNLPLPAYPSSPGAASFDSSNTRSLALWLDSRRQEFHEWECDTCYMMTLEDYERRGSWTNLTGGQIFDCPVSECSMHSRLSTALATMDDDDDVIEHIIPSDAQAHCDSQGSDSTAVSASPPDNILDRRKSLNTSRPRTDVR